LIFALPDGSALAKRHLKTGIGIVMETGTVADGADIHFVLSAFGTACREYKLPRLAGRLAIDAGADVPKAKRPYGQGLHREAAVGQGGHSAAKFIGQINIANAEILEDHIAVAIADRNMHHLKIVGLDAIAVAVAPGDRDAGMDVGDDDGLAFVAASATNDLAEHFYILIDIGGRAFIVGAAGVGAEVFVVLNDLRCTPLVIQMVCKDGYLPQIGGGDGCIGGSGFIGKVPDRTDAVELFIADVEDRTACAFAPIVKVGQVLDGIRTLLGAIADIVGIGGIDRGRRVDRLQVAEVIGGEVGTSPSAFDTHISDSQVAWAALLGELDRLGRRRAHAVGRTSHRATGIDEHDQIDFATPTCVTTAATASLLAFAGVQVIDLAFIEADQIIVEQALDFFARDAFDLSLGAMCLGIDADCTEEIFFSIHNTINRNCDSCTYSVG
jgi:hypothetical protein